MAQRLIVGSRDPLGGFMIGNEAGVVVAVPAGPEACRDRAPGRPRRRASIRGLWHSFCAMLARADVGLQKAQQLMGHRDPRMTMQVYCHLESSDLRAAVDRLQDAQLGAVRIAGT